MARFTALIDANVLYKNAVRDILIEVALTGVFRARWSKQINDEWSRNLLQNNAKSTPEGIAFTLQQMERAILDAAVSGYEALEPCLALPDAGDHHVLAAAIVGRADVIVTFNLRHFPSPALEAYGIEAQDPDVFLNHQIDLAGAPVLAGVKKILLRRAKPVEEYATILANNGLPTIAAYISKNKKRLEAKP